MDGDGVWNVFQQQLLDQLKRVPNLIVISLGHPLEREIFKNKHDIAIFELGSFHIPMLNALIDMLCPLGTLQKLYQIR